MRLKSLLKLTSLLLVAAAMMLPATAEAQARKRSSKRKATTTAKSNGVGTLTVYYAKTTINTNNYGSFLPGQLITDSNNSNYQIKKYNNAKYKLEIEYNDSPESLLVPKSNVDVKQYTMNKLPVDAIGQRAVFKTKDGLIVKIFKSHNNGHKYCDTDGGSAPASWTSEHEGCYVISGEIPQWWTSDGKQLFEDQLSVADGFLNIYTTSDNGKIIGLLNEQWTNTTSWGDEQSAFDNNGNLLCDQWSTEGYFANYHSIAYLASEDALYINGKLYYRQKDNAPTIAATTTAKSNGVGTLAVFYATSYLKMDEFSYSPGQFVADNINHYEYIEKETANSYILHDWYGTKYTIAKSKMNVKRYTMSQLPVNSVGRSATFVSDDGFVARIFRSSNNGHHYYNLSDGSIMDQNKRPEGCYIFSAEYTYGPGISKDYLFEEQIEIEGDHFKLYYKDWDNVRTVGSIDDTWVSNDDNWPNNRSTYDANGNLLTDLTEEPFDYYKSIAYIADLDAIYFNGKLYYRQKDKAPTMATTTAETNTSNEKVYNSVEYPPKFPGGDAALMKYVATHIQYPTMAQENYVQGTVVVQFVIEKDGSIGEVKVARSVDSDLDKEAVRLVKTLPDFIPGRQDGEPVRVWYTFPVNFRLQGTK